MHGETINFLFNEKKLEEIEKLEKKNKCSSRNFTQRADNKNTAHNRTRILR